MLTNSCKSVFAAANAHLQLFAAICKYSQLFAATANNCKSEFAAICTYLQVFANSCKSAFAVICRYLQIFATICAISTARKQMCICNCLQQPGVAPFDFSLSLFFLLRVLLFLFLSFSGISDLSAYPCLPKPIIFTPKTPGHSKYFKKIP